MKREANKRWRSLQSIACTRMIFGKYKGYFFKDIPSEYLQWLIANFVRDTQFTKRAKAWAILELKRRKENPYILCKPTAV